MVGVLGFEPRTSSLSGTRSNQLSYTPGRFLVELTGIEPATYSLQSYRSSQLSYSPGRSLARSTVLVFHQLRGSLRALFER